MKATAIAGTMAALAGGLLLGGSAWALTAAGKCESGELRTAARYGSCRLNAGARAAQSGGGAPVFSKCDAKFSDKWGRAQARGRGSPASAQMPSIPTMPAPR